MRQERSGKHTPFTDNARIAAQFAQHAAFALFGKLDFLAEGDCKSCVRAGPRRPIGLGVDTVNWTERGRGRDDGNAPYMHEVQSGYIQAHRADRKCDG